MCQIKLACLDGFDIKPSKSSWAADDNFEVAYHGLCHSEIWINPGDSIADVLDKL